MSDNLFPLSRQQIMNQPAGRQLSKWVADFVTGATDPRPHYSTNEHDALALFFFCIEKFGDAAIIGDMEECDQPHMVMVRVGGMQLWFRPFPQAMCQAALLAEWALRQQSATNEP